MVDVLGNKKPPTFVEGWVCGGTNLISQFVPISVYGYFH